MLGPAGIRHAVVPLVHTFDLGSIAADPTSLAGANIRSCLTSDLCGCAQSAQLRLISKINDGSYIYHDFFLALAPMIDIHDSCPAVPLIPGR